MPPHTNIGYQHIKNRRLSHPVTVSKMGFLGDYVPFNFCYRSVMLFALHKGHPGYLEGQEPIIHLVSSINTIQSMGLSFFWTDGHACLKYTRQYDQIDSIHQDVDWSVMPLIYWNKTDIKEKRQAEFLIHGHAPWEAIEMIVVKTQNMADKVYKIIEDASHQPSIRIDSDWYY